MTDPQLFLLSDPQLFSLTGNIFFSGHTIAAGVVSVAAALVKQGVSAGTAFAFIVVGPATNTGLLILITKLAGQVDERTSALSAQLGVTLRCGLLVVLYGVMLSYFVDVVAPNVLERDAAGRGSGPVLVLYQIFVGSRMLSVHILADLKSTHVDLMDSMPPWSPRAYCCHHAFCHCTDDVTAIACLPGLHALTVAALDGIVTRKAMVGCCRIGMWSGPNLRWWWLQRAQPCAWRLCRHRTVLLYSKRRMCECAERD
jgi:hypothetical protein